ncbi:MAG: polyamine aminopropyltransferase [Spirochaetales bacterium]|nr:polyamine aminopropyltransferase [Spirochaetales bacterium]
MELWFTEDLEIAGGLRHQVRVKRILHQERTDFQELALVETTDLGRMMVLDSVIMLTDLDECSYHEMITHVPLVAHGGAERVLVIGAGDGGAVREIVKHSAVKEIHLVELDRRVVETSLEFLPDISSGYKDPRVQIHYQDGAAWVNDREGWYDLIIVDSTDPIGPGKVLFENPFYTACRKALRQGGILITQAENFFLHRSIIKELLSFTRSLFPIASYYYTAVPTYPGGMIGFTFSSLGRGPLDCLENPGVQDTLASLEHSCRYYNREMHMAAFSLPAFVRKDLGL